MIKKNIFDFTFSLILLIILVGLIFLLIIISSIETKSVGLFTQERIGKNSRPFKILKIKTMTDRSKKITFFGKIFRKYKIDELPQLINILFGDMSFVGPRPDVKGYADQLVGEDRVILSIKPGITGPAQLKYKNEEKILSNLDNAEWYNKHVIWPDKIKINKEYVENWSFSNDLYYIFKTITFF